MKIINSVHFISLLLFSLLSCNSDNSLVQNVEGFWQIENISYQDENKLNDLSGNTISFGANSGSVPRVGNFARDAHIQWDVRQSRNADSLFIETENPIFNGQYQILFATDENNSIFAKLISENTVMELRKVDLGL